MGTIFSLVQKIINLARKIINPKNYVPYENENLTEIPDTLILDNTGRVKVDYSNVEVRRKVRSILTELQKFRAEENATAKQFHQE